MADFKAGKRIVSSPYAYGDNVVCRECGVNVEPGQPKLLLGILYWDLKESAEINRPMSAWVLDVLEILRHTWVQI